MATTTPPPEFEIALITDPSDFLQVVTVQSAAFNSSPIDILLYPSGPDPPSLSASHQAATFTTDTTVRYMKAYIPSTGRIIGIAKWNFYLSTPPKPEFNVTFDFPKDSKADVSFFRHYFGGLDAARNTEMVKRGKPYFNMAVLAVLPEWQRMGVGRRLLQWGLRQADERGVECWIDASPFGKGLYEKMGWREVGVFDVDTKEFGVEGGEVSRTVHMIRPVVGEM